MKNAINKSVLYSKVEIKLWTILRISIAETALKR